MLSYLGKVKGFSHRTPGHVETVGIQNIFADLMEFHNIQEMPSDILIRYAIAKAREVFKLTK